MDDEKHREIERKTQTLMQPSEILSNVNFSSGLEGLLGITGIVFCTFGAVAFRNPFAKVACVAGVIGSGIKTYNACQVLDKAEKEINQERDIRITQQAFLEAKEDVEKLKNEGLSLTKEQEKKLLHNNTQEHITTWEERIKAEQNRRNAEAQSAALTQMQQQQMMQNMMDF
jgi:hypothetical protein